MSEQFVSRSSAVRRRGTRARLRSRPLASTRSRRPGGRRGARRRPADAVRPAGCSGALLAPAEPSAGRPIVRRRGRGLAGIAVLGVVIAMVASAYVGDLGRRGGHARRRRRPRRPARPAPIHTSTTFTIGVTQDVDSTNPFTGVTAAAYEIYQLDYDFLIGYSETDFSAVPRLAQSWTHIGRRQDLDLPHAARREVVRRRAVHRRPTSSTRSTGSSRGPTSRPTTATTSGASRRSPRPTPTPSS